MSEKKENRKVKRTSLSIKDRCAILARLEAGETARELATEFNVTPRAVRNIKKRGKRILEAKNVLNNCDGDVQKKMKYRGTEESLLETKLFEWMKQQRTLGKEVSGTILKKKAAMYNQHLGGKENFKASDGWLTRFKERHGLRQRTVHGEKKSADVDGSEEFKVQLKNIIEVTGISRDCIYNCDETGLYWRMMPNKTLVLRNEKKAEGHKKPKNRVTVMLCTNASGTHKIPLFVIGKAAKPRCLKGVKNLPVAYFHQKNAWMTTHLMDMWYSEVFLPEVIKKHDLDNNPDKKIILIMDNAKCHPSAEELNDVHPSCTVLYLPPNVTSLIQPLDQGIIEKFKRCYRNLLLEEMLSDDSLFLSTSSNTPIQEADFQKSFNLLRSLQFCSLAWDQLTPDNIKNCWKNLIPLENDDSSSSPIESLDVNSIRLLLSRIPEYEQLSIDEINSWLNVDSDEPGWSPRSDHDILMGINTDDDVLNETEEWVDVVHYADDESSPADSILEVNAYPTSIEALQASNLLLTWYTMNGKNDDSSLQFLQRINHEVRHNIVHNIDN